MQFAILISVLVALILSAFLLLTHVHSFFKIKSKETITAFERSNYQLFKSLDDTQVSQDTVTTIIDNKSTKTSANYHGSWLQKYAATITASRTIAKIAYTGSELTNTTPNLYIEDTNSPIVVVGNTRLEGNSYIPKQGIKAGTIAGTYYQGTNLYYGRVFESKNRLPELAPQWINYLDNVSKGSQIENGSLISIEKELSNSFHKPTQILYDTGVIFLGDEKLTGNIVVQSGTKIIIDSGTQLTDILLVAPEIMIKDNVKGRFQCIATKKVEVGTNCYLSYPSSITLLDKKVLIEEGNQNNQQLKPDFSIDKNTRIDGSIVYLHKDKKHQRIKTNLAIAPNVQITGEVYCQGNIDFQGTVLGSMYVQQFIARQSGSIYLNHIYNGKILINPIEDYAGLPFKNSKHAIAKWLY